jgi:outer membrane receptor protein involved in Fe transport
MKKNFILFLSVFFLIQSGNAQSAVKDSVNLDDIIVTGSKIEISRKIVPLSVSQISRQDIENGGQINILPTLNTFAPGVFVTERNVLGFGVSTGGSGSISIRGVSGSPNTDVLVLIDGHPQYQGVFGHPLSDAYVASDVEKVEIIRGPASILYGSNAMAGAINIITKKQQQDGLKVNLGAAFGSFDTRKYYGTIGYKKDQLSVFASLNHDQTDGIRSNTDFNITNGYTKVGYELNKHFDLTADFSIAQYNGNDNGSIYAAPAPFNIDITRGKTSVSLQNKYDELEGALKIYHNFGTHDLSDGFHSTDRNSGLMFYQTLKLFTGSNITVGTDIKQYGGKVNQTAVKDSLITVNESAVYAYAQQTLFEKLNLSVGLRLENNSKYGTELIPFAGLTYNPTLSTTFKTSVSKGFRSPTIMEMYLYAPNPDLKPERMMNYEVNWLQSVMDNRIQFDLTAYLVKGDNIIEVTRGVPPFMTRKNLGVFTHKGVELSAKYVVTKNLYVNANYSYLDLDKPVLAAPRQQLNFNVNYTYKIWSLNVSSQYIEKLYSSIVSSPTQVITKTLDYNVLNARLSVKPVNCLELFVAGNNLLDQKYEINYGYPMPGIYFNTGFNVRL